MILRTDIDHPIGNGGRGVDDITGESGPDAFSRPGIKSIKSVIRGADVDDAIYTAGEE